jgi:hypothetical protein
MWRGLAALALTGCLGSVTVSAHATVVYTEPPPPVVERPLQGRPGFVHIPGRWDWKNGRWVMLAGTWERARPGYRWEPGRWERRGNSYQWIDGQWLAADAVDHAAVVHEDEAHPITTAGYPTMAPPPRRIENGGQQKRGWQSGHWDWRDGQWIWLAGRFEPDHADELWLAGRWESQGNYYVWIEGRWVPRE